MSFWNKEQTKTENINQEQHQNQEQDKEQKPDKPKLLLHACCGPCSTYPLEVVAEDYHVKVLFYNPNITDVREYNRRRKYLVEFLKERVRTYPWDEKIEMFNEVYDPQKFYEAVAGMEDLPEGSERCKKCFYQRLEATAIAAKEYGFDYFTTTLSVSPHKKSEWISEIGKAMEEKYGVKYLDENFKKNNGYGRSREISIEYRLYRQDYCGCEFSKRDMDKKRAEQEAAEAEEKAKLAEENRIKDDDINKTEQEPEAMVE